jgi:hypothetical protein
MHQPSRHLGVDVAGRFVGDEDLGLADDRPGDGDALLLAAGQSRRASAGPVSQPDPGEHLAHRPLDLGLALAGDAQRQSDVVERRQVPDEAEVLEDDADPPAEAGQRVARRVRQLLAEQLDAAARRALRQVEELEQGCLAGARRAGEEIEAAAAQTKIEVAQNFGTRAVAQSYAIEFDDRRQRPIPSRSQMACRTGPAALPMPAHSCLSAFVVGTRSSR